MAAVQETENFGKAPATSVVAPWPAEGTGGPKLLDRRIGEQHNRLLAEIRMVSPEFRHSMVSPEFPGIRIEDAVARCRYDD